MAAAAPFAWVLPVCGRRVALRQPTGRDEMLLLEAWGSEPGRAIAFLDRLAGDGLDISALTVSDVDALLLQLRRAMLGDRIVAETRCPSAGCGAPVDVAFGIAAFLGHHRPRAPRLRAWQVAPCATQPGWFTLARAGTGAEVRRFRLPTIGDEQEAADASNGAKTLAQRCITPSPVPPGVRRAVEAAMAALSPPLAGSLAGSCPDCGTEVSIRFDPRRYVLAELSARAGFIAEEMDALAARYHWSECAILDLPSPRRIAYAEIARGAAA